MRRFLIVFICIARLLLPAGCGKKEVSIPPDEILLAAEDQVLMTGEEYSRFRTEQDLLEELLGADHLTDEELFLMHADRCTAAYLAEKTGAADSEFDYQAEYDVYMEEIADEDLYPGYLAYYEALQKRLGLGEDDFEKYVIAQNKKARDASALLNEISAAYNQIVDPITMAETVANELDELCSIYQITVHYPGIHRVTFETLF